MPRDSANEAALTAHPGMTATTRTPEAAPARIRRLPVFIIIACALMMMSIDATIVATALHALQRDFGAPINWTSWTITAYWFGYVVMLPVAGRLSERFGHRRVFLGSSVAFAAASLCCGLAPNIVALVIFRALQAAGGAGLTPAATGIIVTHFGRSRDRALGLFGAIFPVGALVGPIFGGLFVTWWSWRDVFFVNVPLGFCAALLGFWLIPADRPQDRYRQRMDVVGMAWLGLAFVAGMAAVSFLGNRGTRVVSAAFLIPAALSVASGCAFMRHIRHSPQPFIPPSLIYGRGFGATNFLNAIYGGAASGSITLVPLYASTRYGLSALDSGTLLIAEGVAAIVASGLAAFTLRQTGYRLPFYLGGALMAIGLALLAPAPMLDWPPYAWLASATFLIGAGAGFMSPASRNACLQQVPERASTMAALRATAQEAGVIVTLAITTSLMAGATRPSAMLAAVYAAIAILCVLVLPVVARVPEHRGAW